MHHTHGSNSFANSRSHPPTHRVPQTLWLGEEALRAYRAEELLLLGSQCSRTGLMCAAPPALRKDDSE